MVVGSRTVNWTVKFDAEIDHTFRPTYFRMFYGRYFALKLVMWGYIAILSLEESSGSEINIEEVNICILKKDELCHY